MSSGMGRGRARREAGRLPAPGPLRLTRAAETPAISLQVGSLTLRPELRGVATRVQNPKWDTAAVDAAVSIFPNKQKQPCRLLGRKCLQGLQVLFLPVPSRPW